MKDNIQTIKALLQDIIDITREFEGEDEIDEKATMIYNNAWCLARELGITIS